MLEKKINTVRDKIHRYKEKIHQKNERLNQVNYTQLDRRSSNYNRTREVFSGIDRLQKRITNKTR